MLDILKLVEQEYHEIKQYNKINSHVLPFKFFLNFFPIKKLLRFQRYFIVQIMYQKTKGVLSANFIHHGPPHLVRPAQMLLDVVVILPADAALVLGLDARLGDLVDDPDVLKRKLISCSQCQELGQLAVLASD